MSFCSPYYTSADEDNDKCYHNDNECPAGKKILKKNKKYGTNNRPLCKLCKEMHK